MENTHFSQPFVKKFKTAQCNYLYDVNSNGIIRLDAIAFDLLDELGRNNGSGVVAKFKNSYNETDIRQRWETLNRLQQENRYFSCHRPEIFSGLRDMEDVKETYTANLSQIIFELTEKCSQRCKYCTYSGQYTYNRSHGVKDMPEEVALKAVEFFMNNTYKEEPTSSPPAITFYGGDPLLKFDLLKKIIDFSKSHGTPRQYHYSFTTNGTNLDDEMLHYLVANRVSLLISLDGPQEIHDRYRVFQDGRGTFHSVMASLKKIKAYSPDYFINHISFCAVVAPPYDFEAIIDFFYKQEFFTPFLQKIKIGFVDPDDTTFFKYFHLEQEQEKLPLHLQELRLRYEKALLEGTYENLTIEKQVFLKAYSNVVQRPIQPLGDYCQPKGMCIPGLRRLFVDTTGTFYMCEKVGSNYPIGDVANGFDYQRILHFYQEYDAYFKGCNQCWAVRLCTHCFNEIKKGDEFDPEKLKPMCQKRLKVIEDNLISYCYILEQNSEAFKFLETVEFT